MNRKAWLLTLVVMLASADLAQACPGCKVALANSEGAQGDLVAGFFWSILFMLSVPFVTVAAFGVSMYLAVRRARGAEGGGEEMSLVPRAAEGHSRWNAARQEELSDQSENLPVATS